MSNDLRRSRILVKGNVQGVGFRPFVWKRAITIGLVGWVLNDSSGVTIEIQGTAIQIADFLRDFTQAIPPHAIVDSLDIKNIPTTSDPEFLILQSESADSESTPVTPDFSICDACLQEFNDSDDRRFHYPFINCTNCGPRFTIIEDIPYDRSLTTMKSFVMCGPCQQEYDDPSNRRFHAQPNACPDCGPKIWFEPNPKAAKERESHLQTVENKHSAIESFRMAMKQADIVAVKGIGGFHLVCDATNLLAIRKLRERKGRIDKPFAVMVSDVEQANSIAVVSQDERHLLQSTERPIVLLRKRVHCDQQDMLDHVAPGNNFVGVMLPYSPMHYLLIGASSPLIMTSGNVTDEPIVRTNSEAIDRLGSLADSFLFHNRDINVVCDDSVVRCVDTQVLPIRRSRGYAPMPIRMSESGPSVLAVGGEIKTTFCLTKGDYAYLSQHIGDMGNIETLQALQRSVEHFSRMFRIDIEAVVADLHPGYLSAQWAKEFAQSLHVPLLTVQHHFAHTASLLAEHQCLADRQVLACCFDGTGYGTDEAIWGGEFILTNGHQFNRIAHLKYSPLPGGDNSIKKPYRVALANLWFHKIPWDKRLPCVEACAPDERRVLQQQLAKDINCVSTSSMGRLFDAVASIIGIRHEVNYEAQAAMEMEALAIEEIESVGADNYAFELQRNTTWEINSCPLLQNICDDVLNGVQKKTVAAKFHHAVANMVSSVCEQVRSQNGVNHIGLTGGVFQNILLQKLVQSRLTQRGFEVYTHSLVPPNDGGLALGQAIIARSLILESPRTKKDA